ncbi:unnamed protein product [Clavelina lepadiformis]|uniref:Protein kinase domain-containing protein n=1 Tax=Clavelina lepadiformis TaxID=159417 RepID=A0ABP0FRW6_CLALP
MSLLQACKPPIMNQPPNNFNSDDIVPNPLQHPQVTLRSSASSSRGQSAAARRRSLNISHFNALQNAVSNLARIDDFDLEELGYGFFSDVFKVTHKLTGKVMVLKRNKDTNTKMNILREVQLMNRLSHPNILKFKGVCVHEGQLHALTEYINGGDLEQMLTKQNVFLTWKHRVQVALDVAQGINYLHTTGIFHRDLSAKNCLIQITTGKHGQKKYTGIVADLGLAEKIPANPEEQKSLNVVGTPYIMAPEVLKNKPYDEKADVFSFGLLICQLVALVTSDPEELPRRNDFGLAEDLFLKMANNPSPRNKSPDASTPPPKEFLQLAFDCCQIDPTSRPSFKEIVAKLDDQLKNLKRKKVSRSLSHKVCKDARQQYEQSLQSSTLPRRRGVSGINTQCTPAHDESSDVGGRAGRRPKLPSTGSRLSRSFSDISRELLSHAANIVASSDNFDDNFAIGDNDVFSNPFSTLDHLDGGRIKLTDGPSRAILEMTFDLATSSPRSSGMNPSNSKKRRPKSLFGGGLLQTPPQSPLLIPSPSERMPSSSVHGSGQTTPRSRIHSSEDAHSQCGECDRHHALNRAMILSPRGNNLASWWCARKRTEVIPSVKNDRQSLASVMFVLSRNVRVIRRCISLPDMSRLNSLFQTAGDSSPRVKRFSGSFYKSEFSKRKSCSSTSEDLFAFTPSTLEKNKTEDRSEKKTSTNNDADRSAKANLLELFPESSRSLSRSGSLNPIKETNLDVEEDHKVQDVRGEIEEKEDTSRKSPHFKVNSSLGEEDNSSVDANSYHRARGHSSSSSGCSSSSFVMSLQTGEMTQQRRRSLHGVDRRSKSHCRKEENVSSNNNNYLDDTGDDGNREDAHDPDLDNSIPRKSTNRDSGYEDILPDDTSHCSLLSNNYSDPKNGNRHITWDIPEEAPPYPGVDPSAIVGHYGHQIPPFHSSTDCNSNSTTTPYPDYQWYDAVK